MEALTSLTTFAGIKEATEGIFTTYLGGDIPAGHFGVITIIHGSTVTYLLEGTKDNPDAAIKGRVVITEKKNGKLFGTAFHRGGLLGGNHIGRITSHTDAFAKMV